MISGCLWQLLVAVEGLGDTAGWMRDCQWQSHVAVGTTCSNPAGHGTALGSSLVQLVEQVVKVG